MQKKRVILPSMPDLFAPPPPPRGLHFDEWVLVGGAPECELVILDEVLHGATIHHWDGRSYPCLRSKGQCPVCEAGGDKIVRWEGYLTVRTFKERKLWWLRVSPHMVKVEPRLESKNPNLRGVVGRFWRKGSCDRGKKFASINLGHRIPPERLADPIQWDEFLRQMWEAEGQQKPTDSDPTKKITY